MRKKQRGRQNEWLNLSNFKIIFNVRLKLDFFLAAQNRFYTADREVASFFLL